LAKALNPSQQRVTDLWVDPAHVTTITVQNTTGSTTPVNTGVFGVCMLAEGNNHPAYQVGQGDMGGGGLLYPQYATNGFSTPALALIEDYKPSFIRFFSDNWYPWRLAVSKTADIAKRPGHYINPDSNGNSSDHHGVQIAMTPLWFGPREMGKLKKTLADAGQPVTVMMGLPMTYRHWLGSPDGYWGADCTGYDDYGVATRRVGGYDAYLSESESTITAQYAANYVEFCNGPSPAVAAGKTATEYQTSTGWQPTTYKYVSPLTLVGAGNHGLHANMTLAATTGVPAEDTISSWGEYAPSVTLSYGTGSYYKLPPGNMIFRCKVAHKRYGEYCYDMANATLGKNIIPGLDTGAWRTYWDWISKVEEYAEGEEAHATNPVSWKATDKAPAGYFGWLRDYMGDPTPYGFEYWEYGNEISRYWSPEAFLTFASKVYPAIKSAYVGADSIKVGAYVPQSSDFIKALREIYAVNNFQGDYLGGLALCDFVIPHTYMQTAKYPAARVIGDEDYQRQILKTEGIYTVYYSTLSTPAYEVGDIIRYGDTTGRFYQCIQKFYPGWGALDGRYPEQNIQPMRPEKDTGWADYWVRTYTIPLGYIMKAGGVYYICTQAHTFAESDYCTSTYWPTTGATWSSYWTELWNLDASTSFDYQWAKTGNQDHANSIFDITDQIGKPVINGEWAILRSVLFGAADSTNCTPMNSLAAALSTSAVFNVMLHRGVTAAALYRFSEETWYNTEWGRLARLTFGWSSSDPVVKFKTPVYYVGKLYNTLCSGNIVTYTIGKHIPENLDILIVKTATSYNIFITNFHPTAVHSLKLRLPLDTGTRTATLYTLTGDSLASTNGDSGNSINDPTASGTSVTVDVPQFTFSVPSKSLSVLSVPISG